MTPTTGCYLDWNASAPILPEVQHAVADALLAVGNPSSIHRFGRSQRARMEDSREAVARLMGGVDAGVRPAHVVFTSGGTEALALALHGLTPDQTLQRPAVRLLVSAVEHPAVHAAAHAVAGEAPTVLPVTAQGLIAFDALQRSLDECQRDSLMPLVAIQCANNETGVLQPIAEIAAMVHQAGGLIVCDAVQAAGKISLSLADLGVDAVTLSAHKLGGLQGCGALVLRKGRGVRPLMAGGGQERGLRGGTPNIPGIVGFGVAARAVCDHLEKGAAAAMAALRDWLESEILSLAPTAVIYGKGSPRLPNTVSVGLPGVDQQRQVMALDLAGVAVSAGSACSSGKVAPSAVLMAMGASEEQARQTIRISFGPKTSQKDLEMFLKAWEPLAKAAQ